MKKFQTLSGGMKLLAYGLVLVASFALLFFGFRLAYRNKIYPGVSANGVYLGGLSRTDAVNILTEQSSRYSQMPQTIVLPSSTVTISPNDMGTIYYNAQAVNEAILVGRDGNLLENFANQIGALFGMQSPISAVSFDQIKATSFLVNQNELTTQPVINSKVEFQNTTPQITQSVPGKRLNLASVQLAMQNNFAQLNNKPLNAPYFEVSPTISSSQLQIYTPLWKKIEKQPLTLTHGTQSWNIDQKTVSEWLAATPTDTPVKVDMLNHFYTLPLEKSSTYFDAAKIQAWVHGLAGQINVEPQDAALTVVDGKATVFAQSRDGKSLNEITTTSDIQKMLSTDSNISTAPLNITVTKAAVSNENLDNLGIKELISEGVTIFPGSPSNRLQNVRAGSKKFNGVLLKPGQVFSFGEYLGEVSAATGYAPGLIILGDHEEQAYGGGLCQVSSTAYRAALLAGLPILQRTNHAFAISYYTAPYGVPGVDATIYYPQVDMKFLNDTGHYILMQTEMIGSTLKFRYYGTKTKSGTIRGPEYISGNSDPTIPSHTVFYRDVLDLAGNVTKTDTIHTYYKSSLDFPITD